MLALQVRAAWQDKPQTACEKAAETRARTYGRRADVPIWMRRLNLPPSAPTLRGHSAQPLSRVIPGLSLGVRHGHEAFVLLVGCRGGGSYSKPATSDSKK